MPPALPPCVCRTPFPSELPDPPPRPCGRGQRRRRERRVGAYDRAVAGDTERPDDLVGRLREWSVLERAVERARRGRGGVVLLGGEPGIGKTRLLADVVELAARRGAATGLATCVASGRPYWPWRQLLRSLDRSVVFDAEQPDERMRAELFESVEELLGAVAGAGGVVLGIDDLQWADVPSLRLLSLVGRSTPLRPILIVGAYRAVEVGPDHPLSTTIGELGAAASVLALEGLGVEGVAELLGREGVDLALAAD